MADTLLNCYQGDHTLCHEHSFVCTAKKPWPRPFAITDDGVSRPDDTLIFPTDQDTKKLFKLLNERFDPAVLEQTYLNKTQNKCEACNRALSKALPKNIEFPRQTRARAHAAAHSVNNGPGKSLILLLKEAGCALPRKSKVVRQLETKDKKRQYDKDRQKTPKFTCRRLRIATTRFRNYDRVKHEKHYNSGGVRARKQGQTNRKKAHFITNNEHGYGASNQNKGKKLKAKKDIKEMHSYC